MHELSSANAMLRKIEPEMLMCPNCGCQLDLQVPGKMAATRCTSNSCNYTEPAGSPYYATHFGAVVRQYLAQRHNVLDSYLGNQKMSMHALFSPRGMLHILMQRSEQIGIDSFANLGMGEIVFAVIPDKNAILNHRVVIREPKFIDIPSILNAVNNSIIIATAVIDETMEATKTRTKANRVHQLCLEDIVNTGSQLRNSFADCFDQEPQKRQQMSLRNSQ